MFAGEVEDPKKALLFAKEQVNLAPKVLDKKNIEASQMYLVLAFVYYKLAAESRYEGSRTAMKSNAFDNLKIAQEVFDSHKASS